MHIESFKPVVRLLSLILLFGAAAGYGQTKFDMTTQLRQWNAAAPAHAGVIPIWDVTSSTYIPGDPFVSSNTPSIVQKTNSTSTGSVASLAKAYTSNVVANDSLIAICGVGNGTAPTISDTLSNTWKQAVQVANGTAFNVGIFYAVGTPAGADTVTCNNGGTTASIALEIYEVSGLIIPGTTYAANLLDQATSNTSGAATTSPVVTITPLEPNELSFTGFALGTAAQTITVTAPYNNDSGQLNPTTPAGLFSMVGASNLLGLTVASLPSATVSVAEPWAVVTATFKMSVLPIGGSVNQGNPAALTQKWPVQVTDGTNTMPTMDAVARAGVQKITDGTNTAAVKAASTAAAATDTSLVVALSPNSSIPAGTNTIGATNQGTANTAVNGWPVKPTDGTNSVLIDPCQSIAKTYKPISLTANTQVITGTAAKQTYFCHIDIVVSAADNVAIVEGTGTTCATSTVGVFGGATAATGWNFAANGGIVTGDGVSAVGATATTADNVCIFVSGTAQVSGMIVWVQR